MHGAFQMCPKQSSQVPKKSRAETPGESSAASGVAKQVGAQATVVMEAKLDVKPTEEDKTLGGAGKPSMRRQE